MASMSDLMSLITLLFANQCQLNPRNTYQNDYSQVLQIKSEKPDFDYIVIGAGAAGSAIAARLSENRKWHVLLIEAGTYPVAENEYIDGWPSLVGTPNNDWLLTSEPSNTSCLGQIEKRCKQPRGKVLGGSSSMNAMIYLRGNPLDYDEWETMGNLGWNWINVHKFFKKQEHVVGRNNGNYGTSGPLTITDYKSNHPMKHILFNAVKEAGFQVQEDEAPLGIFEYMTTTENGTRCSASRAYLAKNKYRSNLYVSLKTRANKINIKGNVAESVQVTINRKEYIIKARKEIILSAGTFNSPQILMLSGIGPSDHLHKLGIKVVKDLPVGKNLQEHFQTHALMAQLTPQSIEANDLAYDAINFCLKRKGPYAGENGLNVAWCLSTVGDKNISDIQVNHLYIPKNSPEIITAAYNIPGTAKETINSIIEINKKHDLMVYAIIISRPESVGEVLLRSKNPADMPLIYTNYLSDKSNIDINVLFRGLQFVNQTFITPTMKKLNASYAKLNITNCNSLPFQSYGYWTCVFRNLGGTGHHPVGTCKMGPAKDPTAVVDSRLRVHGIKRLRVADASIMPKITNRNTNGPTTMIGEKAAEMIIQDSKTLNTHQERKKQ